MPRKVFLVVHCLWQKQIRFDLFWERELKTKIAEDDRALRFFQSGVDVVDYHGYGWLIAQFGHLDRRKSAKFGGKITVEREKHRASFFSSCEMHVEMLLAIEKKKTVFLVFWTAFHRHYYQFRYHLNHNNRHCSRSVLPICAREHREQKATTINYY